MQLEQKMKRLNTRNSDPLFVESHPEAGTAILRIGEARRGETRVAVLKPGELRTLAYALLSAAEDIEAGERNG
jgi:hypothetical protein